MEGIRLEERWAEERCAYCHDALGAAFEQCPVCTSRVHAACSIESGACPSLGCGHRFAPQRRPLATLELIATGLLLLSWGLVFLTNIRASPLGRGVLMVWFAALGAAALFVGLRAMRRGLRRILAKK